MENEFHTVAIFEYSTDAQIFRSKLEAEGIVTFLKDEHTVDSDPLISNAIGGVKLQVSSQDTEKAIAIYNEIREYEKDHHGNLRQCPKCSSKKMLVADASSNFFFLLFPFFEKKKYQCTVCGCIAR